MERSIGREPDFPTEPLLHCSLQGVEGDAEAGFKQAVGHGKRVVEVGMVGEVAHGEAVEPGERYGPGRGSWLCVGYGKCVQEHRRWASLGASAGDAAQMGCGWKWGGMNTRWMARPRRGLPGGAAAVSVEAYDAG
jgi:hypothetical protein